MPNILENLVAASLPWQQKALELLEEEAPYSDVPSLTYDIQQIIHSIHPTSAITVPEISRQLAAFDKKHHQSELIGFYLIQLLTQPALNEAFEDLQNSTDPIAAMLTYPALFQLGLLIHQNFSFIQNYFEAAQKLSLWNEEKHLAVEQKILILFFLTKSSFSATTVFAFPLHTASYNKYIETEEAIDELVGAANYYLRYWLAWTDLLQLGAPKTAHSTSSSTFSLSDDVTAHYHTSLTAWINILNYLDRHALTYRLPRPDKVPNLIHDSFFKDHNFTWSFHLVQLAYWIRLFNNGWINCDFETAIEAQSYINEHLQALQKSDSRERNLSFFEEMPKIAVIEELLKSLSITIIKVKDKKITSPLEYESFLIPVKNYDDLQTIATSTQALLDRSEGIIRIAAMQTKPQCS